MILIFILFLKRRKKRFNNFFMIIIVKINVCSEEVCVEVVDVLLCFIKF